MSQYRALLITLLMGISFGQLEALREPPKKFLQINQEICPETCYYRFRCIPYYSKDLIWSMDGNICKVFANSCVYGSVKCQRQNDCLPPLIDTIKEECQQQCASNCDSQPVDTLCAWFPLVSVFGTPEDEYKEFKNQCELDQYACLNEKPYGSSNPGPC